MIPAQQPWKSSDLMNPFLKHQMYLSMKPIYLDYNASTPVDPAVADAMRPFLSDIFGNPSSIHALGIQAKEAIEEARRMVASLIHARPDEIVFTSGGTESNNYAIKGIAFANKHRGNHIITSSVEHPSVVEVCKYLEKKGFEITWLPVDEEGIVQIGELERSITPSTILVTIMHANNETGAVQPVNRIGEIARTHNIPFHTDAAQSCGKIPVDVEVMNADLLSVAGHKFYAPKGVGALYIRRGVVLEKLIHGADHEQNLRAGTENVASVIGLGKAADLSEKFLYPASGAKNLKELTDNFYHNLKDNLPEIRLNGPEEERLPNTLNISFPGVDANILLDAMNEIAASAGAACHSGDVSVSSVLLAMKVPGDYARGTIRFSLGRYSTKAEVEKAAGIITRVYKSLSPKHETGSQTLTPVEIPRLTQYTHSLGCACKVKPGMLGQLLKHLPVISDPAVLVGSSTFDDAAVYQMDTKTAIVQTVDFIPPVVDDPYHYGAIAAANALSDIYAMGATPLFALNIVAFPVDRLPIEVLEMILKGASDKAAEAGISVCGGHTIEDSEPKFGWVVTGRIDPQKIIRNSTAKKGDAIILTKPLGTGILSTGLKRGMISGPSCEILYKTMEELNKKAGEIMLHYPVSSCTDVTGFGLLGHLKEMVEGSGVGASIGANEVPLLERAMELATAGIIPGGTINNLNSVETITQWDKEIPEVMKKILSDAQTSGGFLISIPSAEVKKLLKDLHAAGVAKAALIGYFDEDRPVIRVKEKITSV
jgi:cysteine desulfurase